MTLVILFFVSPSHTMLLHIVSAFSYGKFELAKSGVRKWTCQNFYIPIPDGNTFQSIIGNNSTLKFYLVLEVGATKQPSI